MIPPQSKTEPQHLKKKKKKMKKRKMGWKMPWLGPRTLGDGGV